MDASEKLLDHLQKVQGGSQVDGKLINNYILINNTSAGGVDREFLSRCIPLINSILFEETYSQIDSNFAIVDLLGSILARLPFSEVLQIYDKNFIVDAVSSPLPQITKLALDILKQKILEANQLLDETNIIYCIVHRYLSDQNLPLSVVNATEQFITVLIELDRSIAASKLLTKDLCDLYKNARYGEESTLKTRLLDFSLFILPIINHLNFPTEIIKFSRQDILQNDDPLFVVLLISFYTKLIGNLDNSSIETFNVIKEPLSDIASLWPLRQSDSMIGSFYASEIVNLFSKISYCALQSVISFTKELIRKLELFKSYNLYIDSFDEDIRLLNKFNPELLGGESFYDEVLKNIPLLSQRYFPILLNVIGSLEIFDILTDNDRLTSISISKLSLDMLYSLLVRLTSYLYSIHFLLNHLPSTVFDYLIASRSELNDSEIWKMKQEALENLLHSGVDLGIWKEKLFSSYSLMKNGRKVRDITPNVEITDEFI
ncbi:uncharacterized protein PRCAT00002685001 [Priceomyces carsonii]|uniref:uncharacterized protein n=1 Tax=Priceomyces carsonii TaxID=28549 RepID=UPI002ED9FB26|nr:unnamed protein product [Priceomyces carsonii]